MTLRLALAALMLAFAFHAGADDKKEEKIDAKKLIGKWEAKDSGLDFPVVLEYTKDGKLIIAITEDGKETKVEGTYKIDGNTLTLKIKDEGKNKVLTRTVKKLTDTELIETDEKGKERVFVRLKDK
jgi:uncharacterized protein (TIGR03066 family)